MPSLSPPPPLTPSCPFISSPSLKNQPQNWKKIHFEPVSNCFLTFTLIFIEMYTFWISKYNSCLKRLAFSVAFSKWQRFHITKLLSRYSLEKTTGIHVNTAFSREYLLKSFAIWNLCHSEKATEKARVLRQEFYFKIQKYTVWWKWVWTSSS